MLHFDQNKIEDRDYFGFLTSLYIIISMDVAIVILFQ